ncbi:MAG TPA: glycosyltransferase family 9 protein [Gemmatimonadaceae bacterium]|nr:glycosyltransferase family 9 protein [Gemmatimonadaceae bacterium]
MNRWLKSLERAWRNLWISLLAAALRARGSGRPPDWRSRPHRVLFLRHDRIGDMIVSTGVLRAIARSHPTIVLDVLASPANAPVLCHATYVNETIVFDRKKPSGYWRTLLRLRRTRYDAVIDCMVTAPSLTTLLLMWASGARHRVGIAGRGLDSVLTVPVPPRARDGHMVELLGQLAVAFGVDPERTEFRPHIDLSPEELQWAEEAWGDANGPRLLVNVSSGTPARRWPDDRYVSVVSRAVAGREGLRILVIGSPQERDRAERVATALGARYATTRTVREAFALVAGSSMVLTPDTSIGHATSAFEKPVVVMFVRGAAARWAPYRTPAHVIEWAEATLERLPADGVGEAVEQMLEAHGETRAAPSDPGG